MKHIIQIGLVSLATSMILVGCGDDSSSDKALDGYFIDSAVEGVSYTTSSGLSGVTDKNGKFNYHQSDSVKFSLGKMVLGDVKPNTDGLVTPKTLIAQDEAPSEDEIKNISLLLRTLQSLDEDNNPENGISISNETIEKLSTLSNEIEFHKIGEDDLIELDNEHNLGLDTDYDGHLDVNESTAHSHFEKSLTKWETDEHPKDESENEKKGHSNKESNDKKEEHNKESNSKDNFSLDDYETISNLSQELKDSLAYMGNEERLAYDVYINLYSYHTTNNDIEIKQLKNIATKSESKHISIVQSIVQKYNLNENDLTDVTTPVAENNVSLESMPSGKYDIEKIQTLYNTLYELGIDSKESALKVGCMVEVTDINDLDKYITLAQDSNATDILEAFKVLRDGSYKHYWAFDKGLKNLGVNDGCYYKDDLLLVNKDGVYPTSTH